MARSSRKPTDQTVDEIGAIRGPTGQLVGLVQQNTHAMATMAASLGPVQATLSDLRTVSVSSDVSLRALVDLSRERADREKAEFTAKIEREKASQEAQHLRTKAEITEGQLRGTWRRNLGEKAAIPIISLIVSAIGSYIAVTFGSPTPAPSTQTVTVESPTPRAMVPTVEPESSEPEGAEPSEPPPSDLLPDRR